MTTTSITRSAAVQVRGDTGLIWARIYWPPKAGTTPPPLLVYFPGDTPAGVLDAHCRQLCRRGGLVILAGPAPTQYELAVADAKATVGWAADHAAELEADPARLLLAGCGRGAELAAEVSRLADEEGWPELVLLTDLQTTLEGMCS